MNQSEMKMENEQMKRQTQANPERTKRKSNTKQRKRAKNKDNQITQRKTHGWDQPEDENPREVLE